jgi:hypothetical protein
MRKRLSLWDAADANSHPTVTNAQAENENTQASASWTCPVVTKTPIQARLSETSESAATSCRPDLSWSGRFNCPRKIAPYVVSERNFAFSATGAQSTIELLGI